jgi:hypothetical protein
MTFRTFLHKVGAALALTAGLAAGAHAASVTVSYTADNRILSWYVFDNTSSTITDFFGADDGNWQIAQSQTVDLDPGSYTLYFVVQNDLPGGAGNPAGLLASVSGPVTGATFTSPAWEFTNMLNPWSSAAQYGTNDGSGSIWNTVNLGPIAGISNSAQWIWAAANGSVSAPQAGILRGSFQVVPVPPAVWLMGTALLALASFRRRRTLMP